MASRGLAPADHEVNDARHIAPALDIPVGHEAGRVLGRAVLTQGKQQRATAHPGLGGRDRGDVAVGADGGNPGVEVGPDMCRAEHGL
jgi:hypothetical protein